MCGVGGFYRMGKVPLDPDQINALLVELSGRGLHATGIAFGQEDGSVQVFKAPLPAWEFCCTEEYEAFVKANLREDTRSVILHTRHATQGDPSDNKNNHPMFAGKSAIIHNGSINNDFQIFQSSSKYKRASQTDSDVIRAIVDEHGITKEGIEELNKLRGLCVTACLNPEYPKKVLLGRSGHPLVMGWDETNKRLSWASRKDMLYAATKDNVQRAGFWFSENRSDLMFFTVPDHTAYIISPSGKEMHGEMKTAVWSHTPTTYQCHDNYRETTDRFNKQKRTNEADKTLTRVSIKPGSDVYMCRNVVCNRKLKMTPDLKDVPLWDLHCDTCGTYLADKPEVEKA